MYSKVKLCVTDTEKNVKKTAVSLTQRSQAASECTASALTATANVNNARTSTLYSTHSICIHCTQHQQMLRTQAHLHSTAHTASANTSVHSISTYILQQQDTSTTHAHLQHTQHLRTLVYTASVPSATGHIYNTRTSTAHTASAYTSVHSISNYSNRTHLQHTHIYSHSWAQLTNNVASANR